MRPSVKIHDGKAGDLNQYIAIERHVDLDHRICRIRLAEYLGAYISDWAGDHS
jgi:hypothetical protein